MIAVFWDKSYIKPTNSSEGHAHQTTALTPINIYMVLYTLSCVGWLMGVFLESSINFTDNCYTNTTERSRVNGRSHSQPPVTLPYCPCMATATNPSHLSLAKVISTNTHVNSPEGTARKVCCRGKRHSRREMWKGGGRSKVLLSVVPVYGQ